MTTFAFHSIISFFYDAYPEDEQPGLAVVPTYPEDEQPGLAVVPSYPEDEQPGLAVVCSYLYLRMNSLG